MSEGPNQKSKKQPESYSSELARQQRAPEQLNLFRWRHMDLERGGTSSPTVVESQGSTASERKRVLAHSDLMEEVASRRNIWRAFKRVKANKGSAGVDGMHVGELLDWLIAHYADLREDLVSGRYQPQAVLGVQIPKASGGVRQLGIPTVVDRLVQQAILQVLSPIWEPTFSESSFGFRPGRSAHHAIMQACDYVGEGRTIVVDFDLEKFFDRVNHDILMSRVARRVSDKRLLRLIRRYLRAGMFSNGITTERHEGTPQGGPLSPLLSNILLDDLDQELESRNHRFCRYADDCNVYVRSLAAGRRVMDSVTKFLKERLQLRVNPTKSAVARVHDRKFLGYRLLGDGRASIAPTSKQRCKKRLRELTKRNRGVSLPQVLKEVNNFLVGWVTYYRLAAARRWINELGGWLRRRLRCYRIRQLKWNYTIYRYFRAGGATRESAWHAVLRESSWWRRAASPAAQHVMSNSWFEKLGLIDPYSRYCALND